MSDVCLCQSDSEVVISYYENNIFVVLRPPASFIQYFLCALFKMTVIKEGAQTLTQALTYFLLWEGFKPDK